MAAGEMSRDLKPSEHSNHDIMADVMSPTHSNRTDTSFRRAHARSNLTANIRDRSVKGPLRWTRSLTEISVQNYREQCRELGNPSLFGKRDSLPGAMGHREESLLPRGDVSRHVAADKDGVLVGAVDSGETLSKSVTLTQLHRFLLESQRRSLRKDKLVLPDIKVKISSMPESYPNIHLTVNPHVDGTETTKPASLLTLKRAQTIAPHPVPFGLVSGPHEKTPRTEIIHAEEPPVPPPCRPTRHRADPAPSSVTMCLRALDSNRPNATERTQQWVNHSPLGADEGAPGGGQGADNSRAHRVRFALSGKQDTSADQSQKKVRFGSKDDWVMKDDTYLFD